LKNIQFTKNIFGGVGSGGLGKKIKFEKISNFQKKQYF
jgi:hypothetical protein